MNRLSLEEAEFVAHKLAIEAFNKFDEPMPEFATRYSGRLESCLDEPFQTFAGKSLHGSKLTDKAAVMFYLVIKNHPFENGNKRMAVTLTLVFLFKNGRWLKTTPDELYRVALSVANSKPKHKDAVLNALKETFSTYALKITSR